MQLQHNTDNSNNINRKRPESKVIKTAYKFSFGRGRRRASHFFRFVNLSNNSSISVRQVRWGNRQRLHRAFQLQRRGRWPQDVATVRQQFLRYHEYQPSAGYQRLLPIRLQLLPCYVLLKRRLRRHRVPGHLPLPQSPRCVFISLSVGLIVFLGDNYFAR